MSKNKYILLFLTGGMVFLHLLIYYLQNPKNTDLQDHIARIAFTKGLPTNPSLVYTFYDSCVGLLSGFSDQAKRVRWALISVLGLALGAKYFFSVTYAHKTNPKIPFLILSISAIIANFIVLLPIFLPKWYLGKIFPNIWHNPTINFSLPFSVVAFFSVFFYLEKPKNSYLLLFFLSSIALITSKPSFLFCLIPIFPLFAFYQYPFRKEFYWATGLSLFFFLLLLYQANAIFFSWFLPNPVQNTQLITAEIPQTVSVESGIEFGFFKLLLHFSDGAIGAVANLLLSLLFPLCYLILYFNHVKRDKLFLLATAIMFMGLFIYFFITQKGKYFFHGNFYWQTIPASYLWHWVSLIGFLGIWQKQNFRVSWREIAFLSLLLCYFLSGMFYLYRVVFEGNYH